jgi:hypothetical protein
MFDRSSPVARAGSDPQVKVSVAAIIGWAPVPAELVHICLGLILDGQLLCGRESLYVMWALRTIHDKFSFTHFACSYVVLAASKLLLKQQLPLLAVRSVH